MTLFISKLFIAYVDPSASHPPSEIQEKFTSFRAADKDYHFNMKSSEYLRLQKYDRRTGNF